MQGARCDPMRVDALVWALTELSEPAHTTKVWELVI